MADQNISAPLGDGEAADSSAEVSDTNLKGKFTEGMELVPLVISRGAIGWIAKQVLLRFHSPLRIHEQADNINTGDAFLLLPPSSSNQSTCGECIQHMKIFRVPGVGEVTDRPKNNPRQSPLQKPPKIPQGPENFRDYPIFITVPLLLGLTFFLGALTVWAVSSYFVPELTPRAILFGIFLVGSALFIVGCVRGRKWLEEFYREQYHNLENNNSATSS